MHTQSECVEVCAPPCDPNARSRDDLALIEAGYEPQLHRSLGLFASFAIPFSVISITTGIFANYGFVLTKAGPFGFWAWPLVACGQILVALVFAEMAGRIPLTGSVYNWNTRLTNPAVGWMAGWLAICNFTIATAAVTTTMLPVLSVVLRLEISPAAGAYIVSSLLIVQLLINLYGVRLASHTNVVAVVAEIVSVVVLTALIAVAVMGAGRFNIELLTQPPSGAAPYWQSFLMASLLGAWCLIGFEACADVSEETVNASRTTPRSMILSLLASSMIGFVFIVVMTLAIPDLAAIKGAAQPLVAIAAYHLGNNAATVFMIFILIAMFSCSLICMTAASRGVFAMARDGRFAAASSLCKVSEHQVPTGALLLVAAAGVACTFTAGSVTSLYGAEAVCTAIYYLITVACFGWKRRELGHTDTFSLGSWRWPVVVLAAAWLTVEIGILTIPNEFHDVAVTTGAVLAIGAALYFISGRKSGDSPR